MRQAHTHVMTNSNVTHLSPRSNARQDVAAAVRAHMAVRDMKDTELARRVGWSQSYVSRRTNAGTAFSTDDLGVIADEFDLSIAELVQMPTARPDDGWAPSGSNRRPADYSSDASVVVLADWRKGA